MTKDEILKMDGQQLCDWLEGNLVFAEAISRNEYDLHNDDGVSSWNFPACAFAARDYVVNKYGREWSDTMSVMLPDYMYPPLLTKTTPLDWLRAAALVVAEQENT